MVADTTKSLSQVKQFEPKELIEGFDQTSDRLLSVIAAEAAFRHPVSAAIDFTTMPYCWFDIGG